MSSLELSEDFAMDIVVNPYIKKFDIRKWPELPFNARIMILLVSLAFLVQAFLFLLRTTFNTVFPADTGLHLICAAVSFVSIIGFFVMLAVNSLARSYPTNISLTAKGLRLEWRHQNVFKTKILPWDVLASVDFKQSSPVAAPVSLTGALVELVFDIRDFSIVDRYSFASETGALAAKETGFYSLLPPERISINLDLDTFTREADKQKIISVLDKLAPDLTRQPDFVAIASSAPLPDFTRLWLDDMQSFKRKAGEDLPADTVLKEGHYVVLKRLAVGGQAKIYLAEDVSGDAFKVVIKEYVLPVHGGAEVRERSFASVKKEAEILSSLDHPGIVKILNTFVEDHRAYLVLEYIEGLTLKQLVQEIGVQKPLSVLDIGRQIAEILQYLHCQSPPIVHRDISPDNLMLTSDAKVRLIDFNVARELESGATRTVVGKHNYMAPEQFKGRACPQSDLYSMGCTHYYLLTANDPMALAPAKPSEACGDSSLDGLILKLTAQSLEARYQSAADCLLDMAPDMTL
ncbi:MAG: serine/threonine protein kinase [Candidatus Obscuribacter sp.]|nr:serine/threonine protein kinase [Candidatus Obscuribacter sp.]